jgi:hypothetical protein
MNPMPEGIPELASSLRRDRIERARHMSDEQKFLAGGDLFDAACEVTKSGIRFDHPDFTEAEVLAELRRRLDLRRAREYKNLTRSEVPIPYP